MQKVAIFKGNTYHDDGHIELQNQVNKWLSDNPNITIKHRETEKVGGWYVVISIWYEDVEE